MTGRRAIVSLVYAVIVVAVLFITLAKLEAPTNIFWRAVINFGHVPLFGLITLAMLGFTSNLLADRLPTGRVYLVALAFSVVLGGGSELLQIYFGRDPDSWDYLRDLAGGLGALALYATVDRRFDGGDSRDRRPLRRSLRLVALLLLIVTLAPVLVCAEAYRQRAARFPYLLRFDSPLEMRFLRSRGAEVELAEPPPAWGVTDRRRVARITYDPSLFPSVTILEPHANWERFDYLELDLFLAGDRNVDLVLRIDDQYESDDYRDRFVRTFDLEPGPARLRIPLDEVRDGPRLRQLELSEIHRMFFFALKPTDTVVLYFADLRLSIE